MIFVLNFLIVIAYKLTRWCQRVNFKTSRWHPLENLMSCPKSLNSSEEGIFGTIFKILQFFRFLILKVHDF